MGRDVHLKALGLYTDPNPHTAPNGAFRQADNCRMRRPGIIEPRPGFKYAVSGWSPTANYNAKTLIPFDRDVLCVSKYSSAWRWDWLSDGTAFGTSTPPDLQHRHIGYASARGSIYVTTQNSVEKATGAATAGVDAGMRRARQGYVATDTDGTTSQRFLADTDFVGYRVVYRKEDANGYIIRSAPSGRMYLENTSGAVANVKLSLAVSNTDGLSAGDTVEIYRTPTSTVSEPGEAFQLAAEYELTSTDIAVQFCEVYDFTPDAALGASLYTNPGQRGELQSNDRPPYCEDLAVFRNSMFYANTTQRARVVLTLTDKYRWGFHSNTSDDDNITGDTATSTALTNIAGSHVEGDDAGVLREGMLVTELGQTWGSDGTYIAWPTYVSSVDGVDSVTLDTATLGTTTGLRLNFSDTVDFDGTKFQASSRIYTNYNEFLANTHLGLGNTTSPRDLAISLCHVVNIDTVVGDDYILSLLSSDEDEAQILIECTEDDGGTVTLSNGEAWTPNTVGTGNTAGVAHTLANDAVPGRLYWSRNQLPEAVPPVNFVDVGDREKAILRIIPTRDALWVLKEDGVWRLSGQGADAGWRVDPVSAARLISPRSADSFGELGVAWFDQGVHLLSGGLVPLDEPVAKEFDEIASAIHVTDPYSGAFVRANQLDQEIYVGVPSAYSTPYTNKVWVYSMRGKGWTTWDGNFTDIVLGTDGLLYRSLNFASYFGVYQERRNASVMCCDEDYVLTLAASGDASYPWYDSSGSGWVPAVGDAVAYVLGETTLTGFVLAVDTGDEDLPFLLSGGLGAATAAVAYVAYTSTIEWVAKSGQAPDALKRWGAGSFIWETLYPAYQVGIGFKSDSSDTEDAEVLMVVDDVGDPAAAASTEHTYENAPTRFVVPRDYSVSAILRPRLVITQATVCWALSGLGLGFEFLSTRHRRQYNG